TEAGRRSAWHHPAWSPVDCSIYLDNCTNTLVHGFKLSDPGVLAAGVYIGEDCAAGVEGVAVKRVDCQLAPGVPAVKDAR
ncbi:MAG: hypothetical protein WCP21_20560, partial [Armatimonadota bacterium]